MISIVKQINRFTIIVVKEQSTSQEKIRRSTYQHGIKFQYSEFQNGWSTRQGRNLKKKFTRTSVRHSLDIRNISAPWQWIKGDTRSVSFEIYHSNEEISLSKCHFLHPGSCIRSPYLDLADNRMRVRLAGCETVIRTVNLNANQCKLIPKT